MVGLLESCTSWIDGRFKISRHIGAATVVRAATVCSVASVLSYGVWAEVGVAGMNFNDITEFLYDKLFLPTGGLLIALFAGWFMLREHSADEIAAPRGQYALWRFLVRFVAAPAIAVILVTGLM